MGYLTDGERGGLKIAMLSSEYPPKWGGVGIVAHFLANKLAAQGNEVHIFTRENKLVTPEQHDNVTVHKVPWLKLPMAFTVSFADHAVKAVKASDIDFDIVHVHSNMALLRRKHYEGLGLPVVSTMHGTWLGERSRITLRDLTPSLGAINDSSIIYLSPMFDGYEDDALTLSNAVIVESLSECRAISRRGVSNRCRRIRRIPPGVDTDNFRPDRADPGLRRKYGAKKGDKVLLYVGRLAARKGVDTLLEVFAKAQKRYPRCVLFIVGDGPNREALEAQARDLGIANRVSFVLEVPFPVLQGLYATADIYAMHSLWEGWGLIYAEAMASGTPCVTTDVGGVPEMIRDGVDGYVVGLYEKDRMADRLVELLGDDKLRAKMSGRCRRRMLEKFSWNVIAADTERLYLEVLADPKNEKGGCDVGEPCLDDEL